jgi:hypothetical protein
MYEIKDEKTQLPMKQGPRSQEWRLCWCRDIAVVAEGKMSDRRTVSYVFAGAENVKWDTGRNLGRSICSCEQATQSGTGSTSSDQEGTSDEERRFPEPILGGNDTVGGSWDRARGMKPSFGMEDYTEIKLIRAM